jgi:hypothetical protein
LLSPDPDVILELTEVMQNVYVRSAYDRRLDYTQPVPSPALRPTMEEWLADRVKPNGR